MAVATPAPLELDGPDCRPLLVAVGASYSDGIGAGHRSDAWPYQLAQLLHWRVVAEGAPGAGYIRRGWHGAGPMDRLVAKLDLRQLHPSLVIIQSGHNDIGEPLALLRQRVIQVIDLVRHDAPTSLVGVLTVFTRPREPTPAARATNQTIIAAARHADPAVLVFDPLANHWHYQRADAGHGLHPTDAGYHWIAERMDLMIHRDGVLSSDSTLVRGSGCSAAEATDSSERPGHGAGLRRWVMTPAATRAAVARRLPVRRVGKPGAQ